jgi:hypothetical protein
MPVRLRFRKRLTDGTIGFAGQPGHGKRGTVGAGSAMSMVAAPKGAELASVRGGVGTELGSVRVGLGRGQGVVLDSIKFWLVYRMYP